MYGPRSTLVVITTVSDWKAVIPGEKTGWKSSKLVFHPGEPHLSVCVYNAHSLLSISSYCPLRVVMENDCPSRLRINFLTERSGKSLPVASQGTTVKQERNTEMTI